MHVHDAGTMPSTGEVRGSNRARHRRRRRRAHQHAGRRLRDRQPGQGRSGTGHPVSQRRSGVSRDRGSRAIGSRGLAEHATCPKRPNPPSRLDGDADMPNNTPTDLTPADGGVCAAAGFSAAGTSVGLKSPGKLDVALVAAERSVPSAARVHHQQGGRCAGARVTRGTSRPVWRAPWSSTPATRTPAPAPRARQRRC